MNIKYTVFGREEARTEKQWERAGFKIKKSQRWKGRRCWTNGFCDTIATYYTRDQVQQMTDAERARIRDTKRIEKIKREAYKQGFDDGEQKADREIDAAFRRGRIDALKSEVYGTAREWLHRGRIVIDKPKRPLVAGDREFCEEWGFYYYHVLDTKEGEPEMIARYLREWDINVLEHGQPYKGRKWWE